SKIYNPQMTLQQFGSTYSGGNASYGGNLANQLGVTPNTTLAQLNNQTANPVDTSTGAKTPVDPWKAATNVFFGGDLTNPLTGITTGGSFLSGLTLSRIVMLVIGIILIGAGLFSFKTTQTIITNTGKAAGKVAEISA